MAEVVGLGEHRRPWQENLLLRLSKFLGRFVEGGGVLVLIYAQLTLGAAATGGRLALVLQHIT